MYRFWESRSSFGCSSWLAASFRNTRYWRFPSLSTTGSWFILFFQMISFACSRVIPASAITRSFKLVMYSLTFASGAQCPILKSRSVMIPRSFPFASPFSVTATVEWPVWFILATSSVKVCSGRMFVSEVTKPALYAFTLAIIAAWFSIVCEPNINEIPPSFARATASVSFETDCITAETIGMFIVKGHFSPAFLLYRTIGVFKFTFAGIQSGPV